ncbi:MAG: insulinase family protein [Calditrichaeota bacterium]|nr:MAG: insulinase family protein [Calditrichota bacterium]
MRTWLSLVLLAILTLNMGLHAQAAHPRLRTTAEVTDSLRQPLPVDPHVIVGTLKNGIRYYIRENHRPEKRAELRLVVNAGSILEDDDQQGLAHFTEHMAFNGTEHFPKQALVDYLESVGMRFGPDLNAYTSFDETVYMLQVPTDTLEVLETGFRILEEWAHRVTFDSVEIEKERGVVVEEWRLGRGAQARIRDKQLPILFKNSRYAERLPIGKKAVLDTFHHETLKRFYRTWYRPDLMAVIAVGDFDKNHIEELIHQTFSQIPPPKHLRLRPYYPVPDHQEPLFAIATDPEATGSNVIIYFKRDVEEQSTHADYRRMLVKGLYQAMFNQRLDELRQQPDPPFLYAFSSEARFIRTKDFYVLGAIVEDQKITTGLDALLTEAERVRRFGFTASELERQKAELLRSIESAYRERDKTESRAYASEYIRNYLLNEPIPGVEYEYELYQKFIPTITLEEVNRLAEELITPHNRVITVSAPEKPGVHVPDEKELMGVFQAATQKEVTPYEDTVSDEPLIPALPTPGKIVQEDSIPELGVIRWRLSNGARVILKPTDFKNDEVLFSAYSFGGHSLVPDSEYIPAITAASIIEEGGVGKFNRIELDKKLAGKLVEVSPWINSLEEGFSGSASPKDAETLFQLIHLYFTAPRKDSTAFLAYKSRLKGFLENRSASPEAAFSDTLQVTLTRHHFRARPWSLEMLDQLDLERSYAIYRDRFADAGDFVFFFVGNVDLQQFRTFAETYLASLPGKNRRETWRDVGIRPPTGVIQKAVYKGLEPKSRVQIVFTGPFEWTRENRYLINSLAAVLRIKLREQLREEEGGTYGVGVWAATPQYPVPGYRFNITFGCAPERVQQLTDLVFQQIDSLKQSPPAEIYLRKVKETQRRKYETDLKRNGYWLSVLEFHDEHGEDPRNVLKFPELVEQLSGEDLRNAARQYLNTDNYVMVVLYPEKYAR